MNRLLKMLRLTILPLSMLLITMPYILNYAHASTDIISDTSPKFINVTADSSRSYAVKSDGTVWGWGIGLNDKGEMVGYPSFTKSPVKIPYLNQVTKVVGGLNNFQLALRSDGTVWSWGYNHEGQLGDGTNIYKSTPVPVYGLHNVISISAGSHHSLALKSDGTVWAWGNNSHGLLGDGTTNNRFTPAQVKGLSNVVAISGSYEKSKAVKSDGTVWEWGYLVNGSTYQTTPKQILGIEDVIAVANSSTSTTLALKSDGTVWVWDDYRPSPSQIPNLNNIVAISNGMALQSDGTVVLIGDGIMEDHAITPVPINDVISIARTYAEFPGHQLAIKKDGSVWAWGGNHWGQLGDGTLENKNYPVEVSFPDDQPIYNVTGSVYGIEGMPVEYATVTASTYNQSWTVTTDVYGKYALSVPSGIYTLSVFANGYVERSISNVTVSSEVYETVDFNLVGYGGFVKLIFKDTNGKPLTNPFLSIKKVDNTFNYSGIVYGKEEWIYPLSVGSYDVTIGDVTRRIHVELNKLSIFNPAEK